MSSTTTSTYTTTTRHTLSRRPGRGGIATASTPNLNQVYTAHSTRLAPPGLSRKTSLAALTQNSLAAIPDDSEGYAYNSVLTDTTMPSPLTPGRYAGGDDIAIGDTVEVPGSMTGTVRFIGSVAGRKGTFAGVELHPDFAPRGKNSGDVDGVYYFTTVQPGAGIFLPLSKAVKRDSPAMSANSFPLTPASGGLKVGNQNSTNYTPPTPGLPKFSQSVGPGRAPSPLGKKMRPSLPRPESPARRLQMTPAPRPSITTPGSKAAPARFGSPTSGNKFAQSVRGTAGDPSKRIPGHARKGSVGPRSVSVLGMTSSQNFTDEETTPVGIQRTQTNGSVGSASSFALKVRPASRAASRMGNHVNDEELERLRAELEDRDRQLKDQATTLAEMETSLIELQGLIENSEGPPRQRRGSIDDKDTAQLRALVREKNEKIAMLTAEFDAHRADFRSTIDTLEMASTETERVYEKKIEELMQEIQELQDRTADVDTIAAQLKQLEELVQELEEGLEDARRGEAEARGEVEFLRGEVERTRTELRREREKAQAAMDGNSSTANGGSMSKELEQKEDEIRGLKAIIHSLSRDSVPNNDNPERTPTQRSAPFRPHPGESIEDRLSREKLDREVAELRALVESKTSREEELERELETLRRGSVTSAGGPGQRGSAVTVGSANQRSSLRDSRGTVVMAPPRGSPETQHNGGPGLKHSRGPALDTMTESDSYSTATEHSTLWCEICEASGHDILTCTNVFGSSSAEQQQRLQKDDGGDAVDGLYSGGGLNIDDGSKTGDVDLEFKPAPLSPAKVKAALTPPAPTAADVTGTPPASAPAIPNPMESGPVAGKDSGVVDAGKWCALCERDGHDSVDCPFEDAF
ncbi:Tip elongation protein 1 [Madurella mycetomatis]|uniref:Tip elongation protein 1 n=1 Tax=Madurella mycetomatis TaxID=100816 RepID=A0A175VWI8_9PEZI|nr:Tip elongation protein 1 [Madurella mycetomatis]KXX77472.1 Tip elongation protein 1 [Madurella mycetomatis]